MFQDDNGRGVDESHTVYLTKYKECIYVVDKKGKKKGGFALVPADSTYEQVMCFIIFQGFDNNQRSIGPMFWGWRSGSGTVWFSGLNICILDMVEQDV